MDQPHIKLSKTALDLFLERASLAFVILLWIYTIISYRSLPEIIPAHYGLNGKVDRLGNKAIIFLLPAILTLLFIGLRFLNKYPHTFNYPSRLTKENAAAQYAISTRMLRVINFIIVIAFSYITIKVIYDSKHTESFLDWWFIPALFIALMGATGYFVWKGFKAK